MNSKNVQEARKLQRRLEKCVDKRYNRDLSVEFSELLHQKIIELDVKRTMTYINNLSFQPLMHEMITGLVYQNSPDIPDAITNRVMPLLKNDTHFLLLGYMLYEAITTPRDTTDAVCMLDSNLICTEPTHTDLYRDFCDCFECNEAMQDNMTQSLTHAFVPEAILPFCIFVAYLNRNDASETSNIGKYITSGRLCMKKLDGNMLKSSIQFLRFLYERMSQLSYTLNLYMLNLFFPLGDVIFFECELERNAREYIDQLPNRFSLEPQDEFVKAMKPKDFEKHLNQTQQYNAGLLAFSAIEPMFCKRYFMKTLLKYDTNHELYGVRELYVLNHLLTCPAKELYRHVALYGQQEYNLCFTKLYRSAKQFGIPEQVQTDFNTKDLTRPLNSVLIQDKYKFLYNGMRDNIKEYRTTYPTNPTDRL